MRRSFTVRRRVVGAVTIVTAATGVAGGYVLNRAVHGDDGVDVTLGESSTDAGAVESTSNEGEPFPNVDVLDVDGEPVATGSLVGRPLVVNLWYAACPPCRREMPDFAAVSAEFEGRVRFVGINVLDDVDTMLEFAANTGVSYELYRDPDGAFTEAIRAVGYPTTVFVDASGRIVEHSTGAIEADDLRSRLEEMR